MPLYRVFFVNHAGHRPRAPEAFESPDDQAAIQKARQFVDGLDIELWQESRLVDKIPRMKDIKAKLEKLIDDAAECDLIASLAADPAKRETFKRLARQHREMIEELKADIASSRSENT